MVGNDENSVLGDKNSGDRKPSIINYLVLIDGVNNVFIKNLNLLTSTENKTFKWFLM